MLKYLAAFLIGLIPVTSIAQYESLYFEDYIYTENIKSVKFTVNGLYLTYPIIELGSPGSLLLRFDDLDGGNRFFSYRVIHCDQNWTPSELDYQEYVDGWEEDEIRNSSYSVNTRVPFTHYWLTLPNADYRLTKSGNYLLVVYEDGLEYPILTRRFMVVERLTEPYGKSVNPVQVENLRTHHEINIDLDIKDLVVRNPPNDISVTVLQNGRWDNAIEGIRPRNAFIATTSRPVMIQEPGEPAILRVKNGNFLNFDYRNEIVFPAGKEFRNIDIRTLRFRSEFVLDIDYQDDAINVVAVREHPRARISYLSNEDINGKFVIRTGDDQSHDLESEYVNVLFTLDVDYPYDGNVYLFGAISDWQPQEDFRMEYDEEYSAYFLEATLKQGYYNYVYMFENREGQLDEAVVDGNWYETLNDYTLLVYYRPFGARYDRLVGAKTLVSR